MQLHTIPNIGDNKSNTARKNPSRLLQNPLIHRDNNCGIAHENKIVGHDAQYDRKNIF